MTGDRESLAMTPYALVRLDGVRSGVVVRKYRTRRGMERAAERTSGTIALVVEPGTDKGESVRLMEVSHG